MMKKELVILQLDDIAVYLMFTDSLRFYRQMYPASDWRITLVGFSSWAELVANHVGDWVNEYIPFDPLQFKNNVLYRFNLVRKLDHIKADLLLNPNITRTRLMDLIVSRIKATRKVGMVREMVNKDVIEKRGDKFYTELFDVPVKHELENCREFQKRLGFTSTIPYKTEAAWDEKDAREVKAMTGSYNNIRGGRTLFQSRQQGLADRKTQRGAGLAGERPPPAGLLCRRQKGGGKDRDHDEKNSRAYPEPGGEIDFAAGRLPDQQLFARDLQ